MSARRSIAVYVLAAVAVVAPLSLSPVTATAAGGWTIVDLGSLGGGSGAWGVSPSGEWITGWSFTSSGEERMVRWHRDGPGRYSMQVLAAPHAAYGEGFDVNDTGTVVGWLSGCSWACEQAVVWSADGSFTELPGAGGALWVSPEGTVVAGRRNPTAARWTFDANGWTADPVAGEGEMYEIDAGVGVGHARLGSADVPVRWSLPADDAQPLPLPSGTSHGTAYAIDQGVVVGAVGSAGMRPVRWVAGQPELLSGCGSKPRASGGRAADLHDGVVVGDLAGRAVRWAVDGTCTQLDTLLPRRSGWFLRHAFGIADDGSVVGQGSRSAGNRAYVLLPPA